MEFVTSAVAVLSLLGLAVSLWILHRQTTLAQREHGASRVNLSMTGDFELNRAFMAYPHLRRHFYGDEGSLKVDGVDSDDHARIATLAEMYMDVLDSLAEHFVAEGSEPEWFAAFSADAFAASPVLCRWATIHSDWYRPQFVAVASAQLARLTDEG